MRKEDMKRICEIQGWCYAVFWRVNTENDMILRMEEAYCEEDARCVVDTMQLRTLTLGQGIIGGAALDGKHRWMSASASASASVSASADDISWDLTHFAHQFSSGIKTIAVLPLELQGVIQLGSMQEISETRQRVDQITEILQQTIVLLPGGSASSSFISDAEPFAPLSPSQDFFSGDVSTPWTNTVQNVGGSSVFDLFDVPFESYDDITADHHGDSELPIDLDFGSLVKNTEHLLEEQLAATDFPPTSFGEIQMDDLTQWLADTSELFATSLDAMPSIDTPHTFGVDGISSVLSGNDGFFSIQGKEPTCSLQSSPRNAAHSCGETFSVNANNDALLHEFGTQNVVGAMGHTHTVAAPWKGLFSEIGLDHLLIDEKGGSSNCSSKSCIDDQWPPSKKRRIEGSNMINNQFQFNGHLWRANSMQSSSIGGQIKEFGSLKEWILKPEPGLRVKESYVMDAKSCVSTVNLQSRKFDEPAKPAKKRARPGESKKPRPKDRQQIAERINELRDLIPNGAKLSIDALLGRTIKHMDYLQNLAKHADKIEQVHEPKLIGQGKGLVQKSSSRNATWAFEVGGSNTICPIIVEDLGHPCQMLIEMLCEEREYFLEMADIVRGYGLTILKGVMEERNSRIWAQFTVEAKKPIERVRVFMSLMQIFQGTTTTTSEVSTPIEPQKVVNSVSLLWGNYQQHVPISI